MGRAKLSAERKAADQERRRVGREFHEARKNSTFHPHRDALQFNSMAIMARKVRKAYVPMRGDWVSGNYVCGRQIDGYERGDQEDGDVHEEWEENPSGAYEEVEVRPTGGVSLAEMVETAAAEMRRTKTRRRGAEFEMARRRGEDVWVSDDAHWVDEFDRWEGDSDFWSEVERWEDDWEWLEDELEKPGVGVKAEKVDAVPYKAYAAIVKGEVG